MTYDVVITDPASDDVIEIVGYIKELTGSDDIADEYVMGILQTAKSLATMPFRFQISEELAMAGLDVRTAPFKDYLLAYGIDEKE